MEITKLQIKVSWLLIKFFFLIILTELFAESYFKYKVYVYFIKGSNSHYPFRGPYEHWTNLVVFLFPYQI